MRSYWTDRRPELPGWYLMATPEEMTIVSIGLLGMPEPPDASGRVFFHGPIPSPVQFVKLPCVAAGSTGVGLSSGAL